MVSENAIWQEILYFRDICGVIAFAGVFLIMVLISIELFLICKEGD